MAVFALLLAGVLPLRADQTVSAVQQALKDQGFYYGEVTGEKSADTTAAIRRYQIRNGLQITGEVDAETLRSLGIGVSGGRAARPAPKSEPPQSEPDTSGDNSGQSAEVPNEPAPGYAPGPHGLRPEVSGVFDGTPYEIAPPDLQRHVIVGAQTLLMRFGLYRHGIDGNFGPGTAAALRAFQERAGIIPDGRLNMQTLSALGLLPGQHGPAYSGPRGPFPRRPVYRGQWVPEY